MTPPTPPARPARHEPASPGELGCRDEPGVSGQAGQATGGGQPERRSRGGGHGHDHGGPLTATGRHRRALAMVMVLTITLAIAEVAGAVITGSLVLLADAAHMAADAAGVGLSLLAAYFASRPATGHRTFGFARAEILAAMANALILLAMAAFIFTEAISRLMSPQSVHSPALIIFGVIALLANGTSLLLLRRGQGESLNVRGAFLEVTADTLGSVAVIITGVIIELTGFTRIDPIASLAVGVLILPRTWKLLREALEVLLEAGPPDIDLAELRGHMTSLAGVREVHDLHLWTITSGLPVLSAHIVVEPEVISEGRSAIMLDSLQACLRGHFDVAHSTFQLELAGHADHEHPMHG
jgi:cobalt-zinc-cadmium efflux system protein